MSLPGRVALVERSSICHPSHVNAYMDFLGNLDEGKAPDVGKLQMLSWNLLRVGGLMVLTQ